MNGELNQNMFHKLLYCACLPAAGLFYWNFLFLSCFYYFKVLRL